MVAVRGNPEDYNTWVQMGNKGWTYEDVLPYFKKFENMQVPELLQNGFHSNNGPVGITQELGGLLQNTFLSASEQLGYNVTDYNSDQQLGFGIPQVFVKNGRRQSTSEAYIWPVMGRRNLQVVVNALVTKIKIQGKQAKGVYYTTDEGSHFVKARKEVIISAGALNSPKLLMLSGIGPLEHLQEMNIPLVEDLLVGDQFNDHVVTYTGSFVNESILPLVNVNTFENLFAYTVNRMGPFASTGNAGVAFTKADSQPPTDSYPNIQLFLAPLLLPSDVVQFLFNLNATYADLLDLPHQGRNGFTLLSVLLHPRTTGSLRPKDKDINSEPIVHLPFLEDSADLDDLIYAIRTVQSLTNTNAFQLIGAEYSFPPFPACDDFTFDTDDYWVCHLRHMTFSFSHCMGSCKMAADESGVVDSELRVKGVKKLRVVDASIMPSSVSGNTAAATIMIAEKAADMIKETNKRKKP